MDRYFMVLASLGNGEAENAKVQDVVREIKISLRRLSTSSVNKLTPCSAKLYQSLLYTKAWDTIYPVIKSSDWTLCHESSISNEDTYLCGPALAKATKVKKHTLEDNIHVLCDKLPILGACFIDVICLTQKAEDLPSLEERVELFGALSRLVHWHRANITMCYCMNDGTTVKASSWADLLPFRTVRSSFDWDQLFTQNAVWRGGIGLQNQMLGGFQLTSSESCRPSIIIDYPNTNSSHGLNVQSESSIGDLHCLDGVMTIYGKFPFASIPPHAVSPNRFDLSLPYPVVSLQLKNSAQFLSEVNSDENSCFVLRLGIWASSINANDNPMDTIAWKRKVVSGNFKVPDDLSRKEVGHHLFLLIGDGLCTKQSATIFALRNTEDYNPKTCLHMSIAAAGSTLNHADEPTGACLDSFLKHLPVFSSQDVTWLRETLLEKQILAIQNLIDKIGNEVPAVYIQSIFKEIGSGVISQFIKLINEKKGKVLACHAVSPGVEKSENFLMYEEMKEPANWPERIFLKEKGAFHKCSCDLEHFLKPGKATFLKIDELLARLQSMENCKVNIVTTTPNSDIFSPSQFRTYWPEAKYGNYPDVCYCSDLSKEVKQQQLNCLEARHIVYDTASSLKNDSEGQEGQVTPRLLPLIQSTESRHAKKITPKKQRTCTLPLMTIQTRSAKDKKHINTKVTTSGLSEKNLQKLRIAVVDALELHDIRLEHPLFKTCAKKLFTICQTFAKDIIGSGSASKLFREIAESHVQQVVQFEVNRSKFNLRNKKHRAQ